jgi:acetylornithine deacetylase/succinyl-diaminopimelate desuccinylase-like protein
MAAVPNVTPESLAESVADLVRVPSVNPLHFGPRAQTRGPAGELAVATRIADRLASCGADEVGFDEVASGRPNVYGFVPGRTDRLVVIDVHTDTVSVEHMTDDPFDGRIEHGCVWGRGALDTKATMGVVLALLAAWHGAGVRPEPTVLVLGSASEEAGGLLGAARFRPWAEARGLVIDQMIVAEPTDLRPIHGHKGGVMMRATAIGHAAHSAMPHLGANAIEAMAPVITALMQEHERLQSLTAATELGHGTLSVTEIAGGHGGNVIPDRCSITIGQRLIPGEDPDDVFSALTHLVRAACPLPVELESLVPVGPDGKLGSPAFYQAPDSALVQLLADAAGTRPAVASFGTNALRYSGFARQLAVFGPGSIDDAHQATEAVRITDLASLASIYACWLDPA